MHKKYIKKTIDFVKTTRVCIKSDFHCSNTYTSYVSNVLTHNK